MTTPFFGHKSGHKKIKESHALKHGMKLVWFTSHDPACRTSSVIMWKEVHKDHRYSGFFCAEEAFHASHVLIDDKHQDNLYSWNNWLVVQMLNIGNT